MSEDKDDSRKQNEPPSTSSSSSSGSPLKQSLRSAVAATNTVLAKAEGAVKGPVANAWHQVSDAASTAAAFAVTAYDHRHEYGPAVIGGTVVGTGAIVTLRRGHYLPGAVAAALAGGAMYGVIYGLDGVELPKFKK